jgi:hypothetical protein
MRRRPRVRFCQRVTAAREADTTQAATTQAATTRQATTPAAKLVFELGY